MEFPGRTIQLCGGRKDRQLPTVGEASSESDRLQRTRETDPRKNAKAEGFKLHAPDKIWSLPATVTKWTISMAENTMNAIRRSEVPNFGQRETHPQKRLAVDMKEIDTHRDVPVTEASPSYSKSLEAKKLKHAKFPQLCGLELGVKCLRCGRFSQCALR
ncbi:hypothetical protein C8R44DRAFT_750292 [Mycena epipterygia]|nr:hypothetical protein C8R44DRAFT_750292 [Mycena epipterygia]